ncbi:hypothetical protein CR51_18765 [Caballeronia megalochromosomata]|nr:hypothetical protein CR51_18765 [Caballeronia megalochromosomata]
MRDPKWALSLLLALALVQNAVAQRLDANQIALIKQTAAELCNTVKNASGKKTETEIQVDVNAKLAGLAGKLADVGTSAKGKLRQEDFNSLSQEATAAAFENDRACRERLFTKMLDKIGLIPDERSNYRNGGRDADLRTVQHYIKYAPAFEGIRPQDDCTGADFDYWTDEFTLDDGALKLVNRRSNRSPACEGENGRGWRQEEIEICTAALKDIDDVISIGGAVLRAAELSCLTRYCFTCTSTTTYSDKLHPNKATRTETVLQSVTEVYLGTSRYNEGHRDGFNAFLRALSRIISGGSDSVFCEMRPKYCPRPG